jgi:DNA-binding transcriptional LysR family regulator
MSPSAVSKLVARLEARLGVRLINRSTRNCN